MCTALGGVSLIPFSLATVTPVFTNQGKKLDINGKSLNSEDKTEKISVKKDQSIVNSYLDKAEQKRFGKTLSLAPKNLTIDRKIDFPQDMKLWGFKYIDIKEGLKGIHTKNLNCCDSGDMPHPSKGLLTQEVKNFKFENPLDDSYFSFLQFTDSFEKIEDFLMDYAIEWVQLNWSSSFDSLPFKWTATKSRERGLSEINYRFFSDSKDIPKSILPNEGSKVFLTKFPKNKLIQLLED